MRHLFFSLLFIPLFLSAQIQERYQEGAVLEENGRVVFRKEIRLPQQTKDQVYDAVLAWAGTYFNNDTNRVVYFDKTKGDIAAVGENYIVFSSTSLALDRALISYRMVFDCVDQACKVSVENIRYKYNVTYQREPEEYTAEDLITDKNAISKGKLSRNTRKFRVATIDYISELFNEFESGLPGVSAEKKVEVAKPLMTEAIEDSNASLVGYKRITPDKIPGNIIKMLSEDWMLVTAGKGSDFNMMTASWGGLGNAFSKPVAFCFINPSRHTYQLMEKYDTYTLTFYTEAYRDVLHYCGSKSGKDEDKVKNSGLTPITTPDGSKAFGEAWMIIECRKLVSQSLTPESISNDDVRKNWEGKQVHKMYIGEIVNVWIK